MNNTKMSKFRKMINSKTSLFLSVVTIACSCYIFFAYSTYGDFLPKEPIPKIIYYGNTAEELGRMPK